MNPEIVRRLAELGLSPRGAAPGVGPAAAQAPAPTIPGPNGKPVKRTMIDPSTPFLVPVGWERNVQSVISGRYASACDEAQAKGLTGVRRVLDIGAGPGAFACWAYRRWPDSWVDLIEYDPDLAAVAELNMPPGAKLLAGGDLDLTVYQVVRIADAQAATALLPVIGRTPLVLFDLHVIALSDDEAKAAEEKRAAAALRRWDSYVDKASAGEPLDVKCGAPMPYGLTCARPHGHPPPCLPDDKAKAEALERAKGKDQGS